jgi:predicted MFS family arabinose efflux permease
MAEMWRDLKTMFRSKTSLTGLAILLSPMGAAAAANLFSGVAVDFGAPEQMVVWITGFGGGLLTSVGALAGGVVCDRIPRRVAYALAALASAACAGAMMAAPLTRTTFAVGVSLYLAVQGIAFAAFAALQLELVGEAGRSGATRYTLYGSAANVPIMYMTWLDGQGYKHSGVRGLLGVDALSNFLAAAVCLLLLHRAARKSGGDA